MTLLTLLINNRWLTVNSHIEQALVSRDLEIDEAYLDGVVGAGGLSIGALQVYVDLPVDPPIQTPPRLASRDEVRDSWRRMWAGILMGKWPVGPWVSLTLAGSWINAAAAAYRRKDSDTVELRGRVTGGSGLITTLPAEARPPKIVRLVAHSFAGPVLIEVASDGTMTALGSPTEVTLDGCSFATDA